MQSQLMHLRYAGPAPKTQAAWWKREQKTGRTSWKDVCCKVLALRNVRGAALTMHQKYGCLNMTTPITNLNKDRIHIHASKELGKLKDPNPKRRTSGYIYSYVSCLLLVPFLHVHVYVLMFCFCPILMC